MTTVKLEEPYLDEWITYHHAMGVSRFYLYDNNDDPQLIFTALDKCKLKDKVTVIHMTGWHVIEPASKHWIQNHKHKHQVVIFTDVDEFIVLHKHNNLQDFVREYLYPRGGALAMNWVFFGDSGLTKADDRPVTERFIMRHKTANHQVKVMAMCEDLVARPSPHYVNVFGNVTRDTDGNVVYGHLNNNINVDVIQLNHYFGKTFEEWTIKRDRGRPCEATTLRPDSDFHCHNLNEVEETYARDFYRRVLSKQQ